VFSKVVACTQHYTYYNAKSLFLGSFNQPKLTKSCIGSEMIMNTVNTVKAIIYDKTVYVY